jgi:hypothetical protein
LDFSKTYLSYPGAICNGVLLISIDPPTPKKRRRKLLQFLYNVGSYDKDFMQKDFSPRSIFVRNLWVILPTRKKIISSQQCIMLAHTIKHYQSPESQIPPRGDSVRRKTKYLMDHKKIIAKLDILLFSRPFTEHRRQI